ncbi:MAG: dUTP diphosphatase [bacterium]|nr:dUTP diphosphatase [bacterium]
MSDLPKGLVVAVKRLSHGADLPLPQLQSAGSAGADLRAAVESDVVIPAAGRAKIPTGLILEIPQGWEGQVRPRSGLAHRHGVTLTNAPGTIDSDYRGEVQVLLINLGAEPFVVSHGDRIAQLIISPVHSVSFEEVREVGSTERADGGFGSTGVD